MAYDDIFDDSGLRSGVIQKPEISEEMCYLYLG